MDQNKQQGEVVFVTDDGEEIVFKVLEQTRLGGVNYVLATALNDDGEEEAYIMKDVSKEEEEEALLEILEDENEIEVVSKIFEELLDDIELS